eukprot:3882929-Pleurochrysis_carterae.AAC.7
MQQGFTVVARTRSHQAMEANRRVRGCARLLDVDAVEHAGDFLVAAELDKREDHKENGSARGMEERVQGFEDGLPAAVLTGPGPASLKCMGLGRRLLLGRGGQRRHLAKDGA